MSDAPNAPNGMMHSAYHHLLQFEMLEWRDGYARIACDVSAAMLNRSDIIHGGVLLSLLDEVGGAVGLWAPDPALRRVSVTVDLNCRFVGRSGPGRIIGEGRKVGGGRTLYFTQSEVRDSGGTLLAYGSSTHRWRTGSHAVAGG